MDTNKHKTTKRLVLTSVLHNAGRDDTKTERAASIINRTKQTGECFETRTEQALISCALPYKKCLYFLVTLL